MSHDFGYFTESSGLAFELGQRAHRADPTPGEEPARVREAAELFTKVVAHFEKSSGAKTVEEEIQDMIRVAMAVGKPKKTPCDQDATQRFSTIATILSVAAGKAGKP